MVKAIIFDCFGVLVTERWMPFKKKYFSDKKLFDEASELVNRLNSGLINYDQFIRAVAAKAGLSPEQAAEEIDDNVANEELFAYIAKELKPRFKIGMLSNAGDNWLKEMFTTEQLDLFDEVVLSYEIGFIKPHAKAYELIADRLEVSGSECVFVDDQARHARGATGAGMQAVLYQDFDQMKTDLEATLLNDSKG